MNRHVGVPTGSPLSVILSRSEGSPRGSYRGARGRFFAAAQNDSRVTPIRTSLTPH
ncbi:MAG: hypothetical protein EPO21_14980 [Chloroflexota bacterium]|nr:MAG: hypothetical protein EPO21_14980 [Chloroflexota bacterium]